VMGSFFLFSRLSYLGAFGLVENCRVRRFFFRLEGFLYLFSAPGSGGYLGLPQLRRLCAAYVSINGERVFFPLIPLFAFLPPFPKISFRRSILD